MKINARTFLFVAAFLNMFPLTAFADFSKFQTILDAQNCQIVLNQKTRSCRTILHAVCDRGRRAAVYFNASGDRVFSRVMVDGVNQTTFQSAPNGSVFIRTNEHDKRVNRKLLDKGKTDTFSFKSKDISGFGIVVTMSGTVKKLIQTRTVSNQEISYLFWDWTYEVKTKKGTNSWNLQTTTEFHERLDLWLGNYVESRDASGRLKITDDQSVLLIRPGHEGFDDISTKCVPLV